MINNYRYVVGLILILDGSEQDSNLLARVTLEPNRQYLFRSKSKSIQSNK
jgi:hypothetical protein